MTLTKEIIEAAEKDFQFVADVVEGTSDTVLNPRTGKYDKSVKYAVEQIGGVIKFDFATGGTIDLRREFVQDASNGVWQWTGVLPRVVAPGTDPTLDTTWVEVYSKDHAALAGLNPADGSAHNSDDIAGVTELRNEFANGMVFPIKASDIVSNGDTVPSGYTHLNTSFGIVKMIPQASGLVADLTETSATIGGVSVGLYSFQPKQGKYLIDLPSAFDGFAIDAQIYYDGRDFKVNFDPRSLFGDFATKIYVNPLLGSDTTGDGSESAPFASIFKATENAGDKTIYLASGEYAYLDGPRGRINPDNMDIVCPIGVATLTNKVRHREWRHVSQWGNTHRFLGDGVPLSSRPYLNNAIFIYDAVNDKTWFNPNKSDGGTPFPSTAKIDTLTSGGVLTTDGPLVATLTPAEFVYYVPTVVGDENLNTVANNLRALAGGYDSRTVIGDQLSFKSTIENVCTTEMSWRADAAVTVCHLKNGMSPQNMVSIRYALENLAVIDQLGSFGDLHLYFENIETEYGSPSSVRIFTGTSGSEIIFVNCDFKGGQSGNTVDIYGNGMVVNWQSSAQGGFRDGFGYHVNVSNTSLTDLDILEYKCEANGNGLDPTGTNNGSTAHESARIVRVSGDYSKNQNRNIQDINSVKSFNVGLFNRYGATYTDKDFVFGRDNPQVDNVEAWMIGCEAGSVVAEYGTTLHMSRDNVISSITIDPNATLDSDYKY